MTTLDVPPCLGARLERARLEDRARRIERVLFVLRDRRADADITGARPAALDQAIQGFGTELGTVRERLGQLPCSTPG